MIFTSFTRDNVMHIHILGISGTFMSALAILASEAGYVVTGNDLNCYPPVSDLLHEKGIVWTEGYDDSTEALKADLIIIGNAMKRGIPVLEAVLRAGKPYTSGPQWFAEVILPRYKVIAIAGTHGKTTTTAMTAFILQEAGMNPGFLIGGIASDFKTSAKLGSGEWFVVEADEYDTAFFDKRPKFMHFRPDIAVLNNLEFDHADIYPDLATIQQQFHYFLRTIPPQGLVLKPKDDVALNAVIAKGMYSELQTMTISGSADWRAELLQESGSDFAVYYQDKKLAEIHWSLIGHFNVENGLAALAASVRAGVAPEIAARALEKFTPVKRRLEVRGEVQGITVYDDFAHHPTAIAKTLAALKKSARHDRILVVMEFASYTMKTGVHNATIGKALSEADEVFILEPADFSLKEEASHWTFSHQLMDTTDKIVSAVLGNARKGDGILVMSNRGFENIHQRLVDGLG